MAKLTRGEAHRFEASFFEDDDRTIPMVPATDDYPRYAIFGPGNDFLTDGIAQKVSTTQPGFWYVDWTPPSNATLTTDGRRARIDWVFLTSRNQQITYTEEFDIDADARTVTEEGALYYLGLPGDDKRIIYRTDTDPDSISVDITPMNVNGEPNTNLTISVPMEDLTRVVDGDTIVYYYDIDGSLLDEAEYQVIWTVRDTPGSMEEYVYQTLSVISRCWLPHLSSLRLFMDKFGKRLSTPRGITDTELYEYLVQGLRIVNYWHPNTIHWGICSLPSPLYHYLVTAASLHGLQVQYLVESDLSFDFSGQSVTLMYDHTGHLDSAISKASDWIVSNLTNVKMGYVRRATPTGVVGVRPYRYSAQNVVFRLGSTGPNGFSDFRGLMAYFGINY
jgi:hypothetical protein